MKKKSVLIGYILAFIAILFFSFNGLGGRFLTSDEGLSPFLVVFLRYLGGVIMLLLLLPIFSKKSDFKELFQGNKKLYKSKNFWLSSIFFFLTLLFFICGTKYSSGSNMVLLQSLEPLLVVVMTLLYYPKKAYKYNLRKVLFIVIFASIGSSLIVSDNSLLNNSLGNEKYVGDFLGFISMICSAIFVFFNVELRKEFNKNNGLLITTSFLLVGFFLSLPALLYYYNDLFNLSNTAIIFIFVISFGATGIAHLTWFLSGRYLSAIMLTLIFNLVGITTIIAEYIFYGQSKNEITYKLYLGAFFILSSITYISYLSKPKKSNKK